MATRNRKTTKATEAKKVGDTIELPGQCLVSAPDIVTTGRTRYKFRVPGEHRVIVDGETVATYDVAELKQSEPETEPDA